MRSRRWPTGKAASSRSQRHLPGPELLKLRLPTTGPALLRNWTCASSSHSSRQKEAGWASGSRSAAPLSKRMADIYGISQIRAAARFFASCSLPRPIERATMPRERIIHIVDDDDAFRRSLKELLEAAGFMTFCYGSAKALLNTAAHLVKGCIVLDIQMPEMDGHQLQVRLNELKI